jgi:hypothetical protein
MRRIIKEGVKTRVLMLSATPVNNRLADLKNQIAFVTEGDDTALESHGISSIEATVRQAQLQFNRWLALEDAEPRPARLIDMLGFDYFKLLDLTVPIEQKTIAGKPVHSIGAGTLLVCLSEKIAATEVEPLALGMVAWHKQLAPAGETNVVFRDSAFADDVAKTNLTAILQQNGLNNVRSI